MVRRALLLAVACAACATVADLEVSRAPGPTADTEDRDDATTTPPGADGGDGDGAGEGADVAAADTGPSPLACACDAGSSCCVRSSAAPACDPATCSEPGSLLLGCVRPTTDGRDCCWRPDAGIAQSVFAAGCGPASAACLTDDDCAAYGGQCFTLACDGVIVGVCATSDASVPSWFACPP